MAFKKEAEEPIKGIMTMKKRLFAGLVIGFFITWITGTAEAIQLTPSSVTGTGTFNNSVSILYNNYIPPEGTLWTTNTVWWYGTSPTFTFDYGMTFHIEDIHLSIDNNDTYRVDYSPDNQNWSELFTIASSYGEIGWGMDTMNTIFGDPEYISQIDFVNPISAQYLRIYATGGDNKYSVGEFQAFGTTPVPEPATMLLFGTGIAGLAGTRLKRRKRISESLTF
ncbi:MAG: PEP-CTERM sorting domain-containing protein [Thermodesulfobacteriota bacterium]